MHKRLAFGCGTIFLTQLYGSSALLYYGIFQFNSLSFTRGDWGMKLNIISASIQLAACAIAFLVVDRWGRRPVFLCGLGTMIGSYVITAALKDSCKHLWRHMYLCHPECWWTRTIGLDLRIGNLSNALS